MVLLTLNNKKVSLSDEEAKYVYYKFCSGNISLLEEVSKKLRNNLLHILGSSEVRGLEAKADLEVISKQKFAIPYISKKDRVTKKGPIKGPDDF